MIGTLNDANRFVAYPENQVQETGGKQEPHQPTKLALVKDACKISYATGHPENQFLILPKKLSFDFSLLTGDSFFSCSAESSYAAVEFVNSRFVNNSGTG